ncbi:N-acetylmuramoyl-L-alanine amidase [Sinanaerobacter chloroacetimidivorans]|uniref:N-acetylmuramoyl-L-alanine amidase n=1 Tax=Sinanaerobacter chloroacetimidivorans TaxID=2818044 RepID=A0A8J8B348_9FIRM|nr:N-acetylmuramoyl-L-alanine amidase [Sinanaerobacter chloroacetimidivorans]MBR0600488.1 N-acetylmuramoyl-L-alanine amidase [Sinanaerobacter chloroacetimidivorans]
MALICIDPGHAASTVGKASFDGTLKEYEFNRAVSKRLAYHLQRHGLHTMYSCNIEQAADTSLADRCGAANNAKADLFLSIHANAYGTDWNSANGWEIYYSKNSTNGKKLAEAIHARSIALGLTNRGVKTGDWYVIQNTSMPAVLIEHEFMTNKEAVERLKSEEWREKWAVADAKGTLDHLGIQWIDEKVHWAETHLNNLVRKGFILSPEVHRDSLDEPMTKGQIFALLDRITDQL